MGGPSRDRIFGDRIRAAKIGIESARRKAREAAIEEDAAACQLWSATMEGYGGPAQPSPTIAQCLNGGYWFLEVQCRRCRKQVSIPLERVRRRRDTAVWTLETAFRCRSCSTPRYAPPVQLIKLTQRREGALAPWYDPREDDRH